MDGEIEFSTGARSRPLGEFLERVGWSARCLPARRGAPFDRGDGPGRPPRHPLARTQGARLLDALYRLGDRLARDDRDRLAADGSLPASARRVTVEGTSGWVYPVVSEHGDEFRLFLWFDGAAYQVKVVSPEIRPGEDPEACHLHPGGRLCLGADDGGGMPTLEGAFARSVLWANGFSAWRRTGRFPF
jgi:hypothetical protein